MPEYDAFGREIDDDPLKAFRERAPTPAPAPARDEVAEPARTAPWPDPAPPAPEQPPPPPWIEFVRPRRRRRGGMARLLLALAVLGVGAVALLNVGARVEGGIDDIVDRPPATVEPDGPAATGVAGASLIRRANFANAVATLEDAGLGRPLALRVAPDRIDATLLAKGGRLHQVQITTDGDLRRLASSDAPTARTVPYDAIDTRAPERLVRAGATRKFPARSIDYLVLNAGPPVVWGAYYKGGRIVFGDAHGRKQRVL